MTAVTGTLLKQTAETIRCDTFDGRMNSDINIKKIINVSMNESNRKLTKRRTGRNMNIGALRGSYQQ